MRRPIKALPSYIDAVWNPRVGYATIWRLGTDGISFWYEEQSRSVDIVGVEHLWRPDVMYSCSFVECPKMVNHVVLQCILKARIAREKSLRHSDGNFCDVSCWVPNLTDDAVDNRLILGSIFLHLSEALAPHVSADGEAVQHHLLVVVILGHEVHQVKRDLLKLINICKRK